MKKVLIAFGTCPEAIKMAATFVEVHRRVKTLFSEYRKIVFIATFALFSARALQLVLVEPFVGIANNGDFERTSVACGVGYRYNAWDREHYDQAFWGHVPTDLKRLDQCHDTGWRQVLSLVPMAAVAMSNVPTGGCFDIRYVGFVNLVIYLCVSGFLLTAIYRLGGVRSLVGLFFFVLIAGDSYVLQYCNSFYAELGSVWGLLLLMACWLRGFPPDGHEGKRPVALIPLLAIGAILLVNSKQQDVLLVGPLMIGIYCLLRMMAFGKARSMCVCAVLCGGVLLTLPRNNVTKNITAFNVIMHDLLRDSNCATEHIAEMTRDFSQQEELRKSVGKNAFSCGFDWKKYQGMMTRKRELLILFREPGLLCRSALRRARNLFSREDGLGNYARTSGAKPRQKTTSNSLWSRLTKRLYCQSLLFWLGGLCVASVYAVCRMLFCRRLGRSSALAGVLFLVLFNALRFLTVLVGDSSHDDIKHFFALNIEFDIILVVVAADALAGVLTSGYRIKHFVRRIY